MKRNNILPYLLVAPAIIILIALVLYPIVVTFYYSLKKMKLTEPNNNFFIWFRNYKDILVNHDFWYSLQNTIMIMLVVIILCTIISFIFSMMLNVDSKIKNILMSISIIPWALPPYVNGILWKWIFYPGFGFVNKILYSLNLIEEPIQFFSNRYYIMIIVGIIVAWRNIPFCSIVLLSALRSIPTSIYDAASIDGASKIQSILKITIPLLVPALSIILTFTSISAINVFDEVIALIEYSNLGKTLLVENYLNTFSFLDFGHGSALTYLTMLISGTMGILYIKSMSKKIEYI